ncbi:hypothetical protein [Streptomyces sclerotialus]|uniref:hypothetical protein n=1 Tax=Streptomyces sclerotialus TaxID=1957 RepID=UPI0006914210
MQDTTAAELYAGAAEALGRTVGRAPERAGSTDTGNVSHLLPTIHPMIGYDTGGARQHTDEFAAAGTSEGADRAVLDGAVAMAWTGVAPAAEAGHRERLPAAVYRRAAERKRAAEGRGGPRP